MTARESGPVGTRAAQCLAEDNTSFPRLTDSPGVSHLVGHTVEKALDATLWRLVLGEIGLHELTPALAGFYHVGHADGVASQAGLLRQARHDAERMYVLAFNDPILAKKVTERMERTFIETIEAEMLGGAR